ncbi:VOC family protein [Enterococcus ureasiticus]
MYTTNKYQKSLDFYTKVLGFTLVNETTNVHERCYDS